MSNEKWKMVRDDSGLWRAFTRGRSLFICDPGNNLTERCPLAFLLLAPIVKTFAAFLSQFSLVDHATQNIGWTKRFRAELAIQILSDIQTHVEAHQIGQAQTTHRVVITEFHRLVD